MFGIDWPFGRKRKGKKIKGEGIAFYERNQGKLDRKIEMRSEYPEGDPAVLYKEKVQRSGGKGKKALDIGCGRGEFARSVAASFDQVTGIDLSPSSIDTARRRNDKSNVSFVVGDAYNLPFGEYTFDTVIIRMSTHSPSEAARVLKTGGKVVSLGLGERDAVDLQKEFGYGQKLEDQIRSQESGNNMGDKKAKEWMAAGLKDTKVTNLEFNSYFPTVTEMGKFLQQAPIVPDFDPNKSTQTEILKRYAKSHINEKGEIVVHRHRYILEATK